MSTKFNNTKWHSYTSSTKTMRTWATRMDCYEEIPDEFQSITLDRKEPFPYTLFLPKDTPSNKISYKYMNYGRSSIRNGNEVVEKSSINQSKTSKRLASWAKRFTVATKQAISPC